MRYFRIFLLHFQQAFEYRSRSFIYFLLSFINPLILLAYWGAVYKSANQGISGLDFSSVTSYYLLLIVGSAMLVSHVEYDIAVEDIQEGGLVKYILRPFSYLIDRFVAELGWRIIQGIMGIIVLIILLSLFNIHLNIVSSPLMIVMLVISMIFGYCISFLCKMILGISAFWLTDFRGMQEIVDVLILVLGGFIMPLAFYPKGLQLITYALPFAYFAYFPIVIAQGKLEFIQALYILGGQIF